MTYGRRDRLFDCVLKDGVAHAVRSGAAQDVTHFQQFSAKWLQTGSEQSTGLGRYTDHT